MFYLYIRFLGSLHTFVEMTDLNLIFDKLPEVGGGDYSETFNSPNLAEFGELIHRIWLNLVNWIKMPFIMLSGEGSMGDFQFTLAAGEVFVVDEAGDDEEEADVGGGHDGLAKHHGYQEERQEG